jgi:SAM-dependent methyltransferase
MNPARSEHILYELPKINRDYAAVRTSAIVALISKHISAAKNTKILDVACGRGELLKCLTAKNYNIEGLDYDITCVELSSQYAKCTQGDAFEVDKYFHKEAYDLVTCSHFLEHTESPKKYIDRLKMLSKRYILLAVPNLAQFVTLEHQSPRYATRGHLCGWDASHFRTLLELHCGLRIIDWIPDQVIIPGRPLWHRVPLLRPTFRYLEVRVLTRMFPFISNSLIVLCEKRH